MAKTLGQSLYGLSAEIKKKIKDEIKSAQSALSQEGNKKEDDYWEGLSNLSKEVQDLIVKAKADGTIPKGTNLEKLAKIPKTKPKRWAASYKNIFGRKTRIAKTEPKIKAAPKRKAAPKSKATPKSKIEN